MFKPVDQHEFVRFPLSFFVNELILLCFNSSQRSESVSIKSLLHYCEILVIIVQENFDCSFMLLSSDIVACKMVVEFNLSNDVVLVILQISLDLTAI